MRRGLENIINSHSKMFMAFCCCFLAGVALISLMGLPQTLDIYFYAIILVSVLIAIFFWKNIYLRFALLGLAFFVFGFWRLLIAGPNCASPSQICYYNGKKVVLIGYVSREPDARIDKVNYVIAAKSLEGTVNATVKGNVLFTAKLYPQYNYGDELKITCALQEPNNVADGMFDYKKYLAKEGVGSICGFAKSVVILSGAKDLSAGDLDYSPAIGRAQNNNWDVRRIVISKILWFKTKIADQINKLWPEPESSFMAGLLYGSKSGLPQELMDNFSKTGVTHIIAVSGFNVTIIATILMTLLIGAGLWRQQAYFVVTGALFLFVIFTGATGSVVRAAFMSAAVLTAQQLGRPSRLGNVLVLTATIMVLLNPYILFWDAGFQLSFLSTLGLVYLSPVLSFVFPSYSEGSLSVSRLGQRFLARPDVRGKLEMIREVFIQTLSAIISTMPLILYQFGRLSVVAPLVNILVLWIIPYLMLFGFVALVLSFIFFPLGQLIAWLAIIGLKYVIIVVSFFGSLSFSAAEFSIPAWLMVIMYIGIILVIARSRGRQSGRNDVAISSK